MLSIKEICDDPTNSRKWQERATGEPKKRKRQLSIRKTNRDY